MRVFGSSGQQRSALLLLDLAAISLYNSCHGDYPLFLIDDVDAELDERRIRRLLEYLESRTQTFITTSKQTHLEDFLSKANVYEIADEAVRILTYIWRDDGWGLTAVRTFPRGREPLAFEPR